MRRLFVLTVSLACLVFRLSSGWSAEKAKSTGGDLVVGPAIQHGNLTIFPLVSRVAKTESRFITLDEGLKAGSVKIMEVGTRDATDHSPAVNPDSGRRRPAPRSTESKADDRAAAEPTPADPFVDSQADVNHLLVLNRSKKPLYLMPGEIIVGGEQDRTIAQEYVIQPSDKPAVIEVFCVEQGRWQGRGEVETANLVNGANAAPALAGSNAFAGGTTAAGSLAAKAQKGEFIGSVGNVNKAARVAVQDAKSQEKVWEKVAEINAKSANTSSFGGFGGNYAEPVTVKQLEPYIKCLEKPVASQSQIVGVAVAIDGKMDTLDLFESTPLFRQLWPKLLKSYGARCGQRSDGRRGGREDRRQAAQISPEAMHDRRRSSIPGRGANGPRKKLNQRRRHSDTWRDRPFDHVLGTGLTAVDGEPGSDRRPRWRRRLWRIRWRHSRVGLCQVEVEERDRRCAGNIREQEAMVTSNWTAAARQSARLLANTLIRQE